MSTNFQLVPGVCYAISNRLMYTILQYMDAGTSAVLSNIKILPTVVWSLILLQRNLSVTKWLACVFLMLGAMMVKGGKIGHIEG